MSQERPAKTPVVLLGRCALIPQLVGERANGPVQPLFAQIFDR
jgi:hypothetical protein